MSNALLSDVEARAQRRRTRTRDEAWQALVLTSWRRASAATDADESRRWLERAHRLLPTDGMIAASLASALLRQGELKPAADMFRALATTHGTIEGWAGLATCAHLMHDEPGAHAALAQALRASVPTETLRALATAIDPPQGWCGLTTDGVLHTSPGLIPAVRIDGEPVALAWAADAAPLPEGWRRAASIEVAGRAGPALGSPLPVRAFASVEGFVEAASGGLVGWAWHPADATQDPLLRIEGASGAHTLRLTELAEQVPDMRPLSRPRRLAIPADQVAAMGPPIAVLGPDGRHLLGSPLDPGIEARAAATPGRPGFGPVWADVVGPPPQAGATRPDVDVIIPVHRGLAETLACLDSVLASRPRGTRVIVVEDASPEPALVAALERLARRKRIVLLRLAENLGFPGAANAGLRVAAGRDAVLLNSDTLTPPGWLDRLRQAAYAAPDIGTATPLTNDGTIVSYPDPGGGNPPVNLAGAVALDALAQRANGGGVVDVPVGVGFCLYLRRDCLDDLERGGGGPLREDLFAQGYGEENDLCLRARHRGWRNVAATGVFVAHVGATSFGPARTHLVRRNAAILARLHPGYDALVAQHVAADPLGPARARMDSLRWAAGRARAGAVVMVTHGGGGGVDQVVEARVRRVAEAGQRPIVLRPARVGGGGPGLLVQHAGGAAFPNLVFAVPAGLPALVKLLRPDRVRRVELHHLLGHHHAVAGLAGRLGVEQVSVVHDYARFCPRIALVSTERRYCGEPDVAGCEACIADLGSLLEDDPPVPVLLERSAQELARATRVIAPSADAVARMRRHFPGIRAEAEAWEDDGALPPLQPAAPGPVLRVVVVGAIGVEKGYEVLLGCVRDARARGLALAFTVVGFTADDERLMGAGPAFVTGEYRDADAVALIRAQGAHLAFIPSVWPETWCFALSRVWQAGLPAAVFELGAQAERVRRGGRGWLLPLGLSPRGVNDALLRLAPTPPPSQCPPHSERHQDYRDT